MVCFLNENLAKLNESTLTKSLTSPRCALPCCIAGVHLEEQLTPTSPSAPKFTLKVKRVSIMNTKRDKVHHSHRTRLSSQLPQPSRGYCNRKPYKLYTWLGGRRDASYAKDDWYVNAPKT